MTCLSYTTDFATYECGRPTGLFLFLTYLGFCRWKLLLRGEWGQESRPGQRPLRMGSLVLKVIFKAHPWQRPQGRGRCHCKASTDFCLSFVCEVKGLCLQVGKREEAGRNFHSFLPRAQQEATAPPLCLHLICHTPHNGTDDTPPSPSCSWPNTFPLTLKAPFSTWALSWAGLLGKKRGECEERLEWGE